jgi:signal transduction histidine kinase
VRHLLAIVVVLAALAPAVPVEAADQKQVLVLYSTRRDAQIVVLGERDLPRILEDGLGEPVDYYSEYLDQGRFTNADYQAAFGDFLRRKYDGIAFDLVIAMQETAADFVRRNRQVFAGAPVVFFADSPGERMPNATGIVGNLNFADTLSFANVLQPDLQNVFVVTGTTRADRGYEDVARRQLHRFESRLKISYLSGLKTVDLDARLAALPPRSIVYYILVDEDGAGEKFHPLEYLDRIASVANAPTYCWVDSAMGHGIVGGSLKDQSRQIEAVGDLALRVLRGEAADAIPPSSPDLNVSQVDWRQLRRWNIAESRVPAGTLVKFRVPSAWYRYRYYVIGVAALFFAQSALIVGLLVQRTRRRQAEARARSSQAELRTSYDRIRDLGGRLLDAQEAERARIARELHDDISQQVALLSIDLELLGGNVDGPARQIAGEVLSRTQTIARSVHDLSHRLHPAKLRLIGVVAALQGLQRELAQSGATVSFTHDGVPPDLPPEVTLCLFRIAQEALQNALKHGKARRISLDLRGSRSGLALTVTDDGVGFDLEPAWGQGLGLISMDERLEAVGGKLAIFSRPGAGARLEVVVPLRQADGTATVAV